MLSTEKATWPNYIWLGTITKQLNLDQSYNDTPRSLDPFYDNILPQHLYVVSDEQIKVGDWVYIHNGMLSFEHIVKCNKLNINAINTLSHGKIIATTNPKCEITPKFDENSVNIKWISTKTITKLPQIPEDFIKTYVNEYNNGNIIKEVMVEIEQHQLFIKPEDAYEFESRAFKQPFTTNYKDSWRVKVNLDNTINISLVKEITHNRSEVLDILKKLAKHHAESSGAPSAYVMNSQYVKNWFNSNYPE